MQIVSNVSGILPKDDCSPTSKVAVSKVSSVVVIDDDQMLGKVQLILFVDVFTKTEARRDIIIINPSPFAESEPHF